MTKATIIVMACAFVAAGAMLAAGQERSMGGGAAATAPATAPAKPGEVAGGEWKVTDGELVQSSMDTPALLLFGETTWKDYTLEIEAQKTGGDEGFLIAVRAGGPDHLVWFNVGGWGNSRTAFELLSGEDKGDFGDGQTYSDFVEVQSNKWHKLKVTVTGNKIEGFLDGKSACKVDAATGAQAAGRVAVGSWATEAKFRNIKVTDAAGKVLWEGVPKVAK